MQTFSDAELVASINEAFDLCDQFLYYGIDIKPRAVWASAKTNEFIAEWTVQEEHISSLTGCIDEGCLGTLTDNITAMLIIGLVPSLKSVSTSISIRGLAPIAPGTEVEILCRLTNERTRQPHATAVFRDKHDRSKVYGMGSHTKFFKAGLVETQPKM
ncbi:hypothetical protein J3B02_006521 [Coemansia erecta]|uniref:Thioesterase domain-containing protein n=1 Tax=Coemansia asiatica TaxID=1052880 RepID=A0A9W7XIW6_9FUNG|nr:hypothetical protein LPJ64_004172 [Coemansia asiatica]KAJ2836036.1 hypothetical protein J3B02_006521 [Coemansia erecta]KAJ2883996.1 hypothetical protein FB639_002049 [Coemansia asiatica]